jgi:hypothetical protein
MNTFNTLMTKVIWQKKGKWEFIPGSLGFLVGLTMVLLCIQLYADIDFIFHRRLSLEKQLDYIIISKKLDTTTILDETATGFTERDIIDLESQPFTRDTGIIRANEFTVRAAISAFGKGFITELFFESVPDRFLDHIPDSWAWTEENGKVPIMISRDFLTLYNFGFSQARDFPFLTEEMFNLINVKLELYGNGKYKKVDARIAGLSDRISSLLVPESFMKWANEHYRHTEISLPSRVIISVQNRADPDIIRYIESNNYEVSREKLRLSDAGFTIGIILGVLAFIGILLVILSFVVFIVTFRLTLSHAGPEITLLMDLGYTRWMIIKHFIKLTIPLFGTILAAAGIIFFIAITLFHRFLILYNITPPGIFFPVIISTGLGLALAGMAGNYLSLLFMRFGDTRG